MKIGLQDILLLLGLPILCVGIGREFGMNWALISIGSIMVFIAISSAIIKATSNKKQVN